MQKQHKVLALGIDAGDLDFVEARRHRLPALSRLIQEGRMYCPAAPKALSGSVWPTFYTGKHPGHHGMYQHLVWDANRMGLRRIGPDWCASTPFWQELEERGRNVIVVDVPYSFPAYLKRGVEVTDWGTHGQTYPLAGNRAEVTEFLGRFGPGLIGRETPVQKTPAQLEGIRRRLLESAARKGELISSLLSTFSWDVFVGVFGECHRGGHTLFSDSDAASSGDEGTALLDVYRAVDEALGRILERVDRASTTVLLFSVHGMMRDNAQGHLVRPVMRRINNQFVGNGNARGSGVVRFLRQAVPAQLQHAVGAAAPDSVRQWVVEKEIVGGMDWAKTPGFALRTDIRTELRLNLRGRERDGLLEAGGDDHQGYVDLVKEAFLEIRDAETDAPLVDEVVDIPALFPGDRNDRLPDLVVTWKDAPSARRAHSPRIGSLTVDPSGARGGDHTDFGFAVLAPAEGMPDNLSPLETTWDFAEFVSRLAEAV